MFNNNLYLNLLNKKQAAADWMFDLKSTSTTTIDLLGLLTPTIIPTVANVEYPASSGNYVNYILTNNTGANYVSVTNPNFVVTEGGFSVVLWVKFPSRGTVVCYQHGILGSSVNWSVAKYWDDGTTLCRFHLKGTGGGILVRRYTNTLNVWTHYVFTYDGGSTINSIKCYKNGVEIASSGDIISGTFTKVAEYNLPIYQGRLVGQDGGTSTYFYVDRTKYIKTVLTETDALAIYNAEKSTFGL